MGFLISFVKNGEIKPSLSYKIIIEQGRKKRTWGLSSRTTWLGDITSYLK